MSTFRRAPRGSRTKGFSLIEVMVAVVILATGLLALAALQGALARNAADSKARAAIIAAMNSRMAEVRQAPPATAGSTSWTTAEPWVQAAAEQAGASDLEITETVVLQRWNGTGFVTTAVTDPSAQFTRVVLEASWSDATSADRTLTLGTDISGRIYGDGKGFPNPPAGGSATKRPIVRQDDPSNTPGVIPIASGNQATAASNPQPILEGRRSNQIVGTRFDVLTYIPEGATRTAIIQKRFDTSVIKCRCQFQTGTLSAEQLGVAGKAQWPAVWNGETYKVANPTGVPAGVAAKGAENPAYAGTAGGSSTRAQSELCTECCRDRHDTAISPVKFDPEATAYGKKYDWDGTTLVDAVNSTNKTYVDSCRVVRTGGLWRTTADTYARQFGLLETKPDAETGLVPAKDGAPTNPAVLAYTGFVKSYLANYTGTSATPPLVANNLTPQEIFEADTVLQQPALITFTAPSSSDERYLHARGLYVDHLEADALKAIKKAYESCPDGTAKEECILPYLPFTTINLTEMALWSPSSESVLSVNSGSLLQFNVTQPYGGRTRGIGVGEASTVGTLRKSNSGVAVSDDLPGATDKDGDEALYTDSQGFKVDGTAGGGVDRFWVNIPSASAVTAVTYTIGLDVGGCYGNTKTPTKYDCATSSVLPKDVSLLIGKYNREQTTKTSMSYTCTVTGSTDTKLVTANVDKPVLQNYAVASITGGTVGTVIHENFADERTPLTIPNVAKNSTLQVVLTLTSTRDDATIAKCLTDKNGNKMTVTEWNKPWTVLLP